MVSIGGSKNYGPKPFKIFNYWCDQKDFLRWVEEAWDIEVSGTPMFKLYQKLKATKVKLKTINKDLFVGITQRVEMARGKLENFQRKMLNSGSCLRSKRVEDELPHEYISISSAEEAFFKQKSGINGLTWGIIILLIFTALLRLGKKEMPLNACWMVMGIE